MPALLSVISDLHAALSIQNLLHRTLHQINNSPVCLIMSSNSLGQQCGHIMMSHRGEIQLNRQALCVQDLCQSANFSLKQATQVVHANFIHSGSTQQCQGSIPLTWVVAKHACLLMKYAPNPFKFQQIEGPVVFSQTSTLYKYYRNNLETNSGFGLSTTAPQACQPIPWHLQKCTIRSASDQPNFGLPASKF